MLNPVIDMGWPLILPLNFPETPDVSSVGRIDGLSLSELMTWEQAPTGPRRFDEAGLSVSLTTAKIRRRDQFDDNLRRAIEHSLCFSAIDGESLVGFARVVTDRATFAYLCDVFVLPEARGLGVSKALMQAIDVHPDLQGLRRFLLATADAHGLYAQYGFAPLTGPERFMERYRPEVYRKV